MPVFYLRSFEIQLNFLGRLVVNIQSLKDYVNQLFQIQMQNVLQLLDILNQQIQRLSNAMFFKYFPICLFWKYKLQQCLEIIFR